MTFIILFIGLCALFGWFMYGVGGGGDFIDYFFGAILTIAVALGATALVVLFVVGLAPKEESFYTVDICSAASKDNIQGTFLFGSGTVGSVDMYSTFIARGNGKVKYTFESRGVVVVEKNGVQPHLKFRKREVKENLWSKFWGITGFETVSADCVEMTIPENSVTTSFKID